MSQEGGQNYTPIPLTTGSIFHAETQTGPTSLRVRLQTRGADSDRVWETVQAGIKRLLAEHGLDHVAVERAEESPEQSKGGKFRQVLPLVDSARS